MNGMVREAFGDVLLELGRDYPNMVVLDADIAASLKTAKFAARYPERHFNFGTAEQNMVMAAAGLSTVDLIPLACTFATFCTMRACEQIRSFICYANLNVKIVGSHGGIENSWDGPTHQATEDVAIMRAMPNMTVVVPADAVATPPLTRQLVEMQGPAYLRMMRNPSPIIYGKEQTFTLGQAIMLRDGADVTLIAMGRLVPIALDAADALAREGIQARVLDMHTVKPLDTDAVERAALETDAIVTAEDHNIIGGLGGAVAECLAERGLGPLVRVGVRDTFARSGDPGALYDKYGLSRPHVVEAARQALEIKTRGTHGRKISRP